MGALVGESGRAIDHKPCGNTQNRNMSRSKSVIRFHVGLLICGTLLSISSNAQDDIQTLRAEIARMRAEYESKIQQLENRLTQLATAQERTAKSTENAVE